MVVAPDWFRVERAGLGGRSPLWVRELYGEARPLLGQAGLLLRPLRARLSLA